MIGGLSPELRAERLLRVFGVVLAAVSRFVAMFPCSLLAVDFGLSIVDSSFLRSLEIQQGS